VRATSAPNAYIFTELLQTPQIQALASSDEFASFLTVLQIFSYGTYSSYTSTAGLPDLNDAQRLKLRQLSLLTLAKKDSSNPKSPALDYASLQKALDLPSRQALEELVISAIYAGLIKAQLNPKGSLVQINSVAPLRDVAPTAISGLLSSLQAWAGRCEATLDSLSSQMTQLRADADRRAARAATRTQETHKLMENEQKGGPPLTSPATAFAAHAPAAAANTAAALSRRSHLAQLHKPGSSSTSSGGGGNSINNNTTSNTANNEMNSVLTVGGGSSFTPDGGPVASTGPAGPANLQVRSAVKRGSDDMDDDGDAGGVGGLGEAMDMDDEAEDPDGKSRASRRKLEA
jgi:COP9 signalosome complex subunit 7